MNAQQIQRRSFVAAAVAMTMAVMAGSVQAQSNVIKVVVPFTAGGVSDAAARALVERMSRAMGQTMIIENRPGAGSRIGTEAVIHAPPDGTTLLFTNTTYSILPIVDQTVKYDPAKALAPVVLAATYGLPVVVSTKLRVNSLQEFIAYAKQNPGKLSYGSSGPGSGTNFAGEYFKLLTGTDMVHVPYKSTSAAAMDVAAGLLDLAFDAAAKPYADAGKVKIVAVTGDRRDPRMPDVPTVAEAGLKAFTFSSWVGLLAPAGTPSSVVQKLNQAAAAALADPALRKTMNDLGLNPAGGPPEAMATAIGDDLNLYRKIVKEANLKLQ